MMVVASDLYEFPGAIGGAISTGASAGAGTGMQPMTTAATEGEAAGRAALFSATIGPDALGVQKTKTF